MEWEAATKFLATADSALLTSFALFTKWRRVWMFWSHHEEVVGVYKERLADKEKDNTELKAQNKELVQQNWELLRQLERERGR